jgi:hypothetical protein
MLGLLRRPIATQSTAYTSVLVVCLPGPIAGKLAPTGTSQGLRLALYLWELACRR